MVQLIRTGYSVRRSGNIVFVCGGNSASDMRMQFKSFCQSKRIDFEIFFPEFAMKDYFSNDHVSQFDITEFELIIGNLSHAIVMFPEAAGSYAELGYFSHVDELAKKIILVLDQKWQSKDSFMSMGPVKKIGSKSKFYAELQMPYAAPDFEVIIERINRFPLQKTRKSLSVEKFKDLTDYEIFCLVYQCFSFLRIATINDVLFLMNAIFQTRFKKHKVSQIASILFGSEYIDEIGSFGHYYTKNKTHSLLMPRTGFQGEDTDVNIQIASILEKSDRDFYSILEDAKNAA